jgi:hypothetical protein
MASPIRPLPTGQALRGIPNDVTTVAHKPVMQRNGRVKNGGYNTEGMPGESVAKSQGDGYGNMRKLIGPLKQPRRMPSRWTKGVKYDDQTR